MRRDGEALPTATINDDAYFTSRFTSDNRRTVLWETLCRSFFQRRIGEDQTVLELGAGYCAFINHIRARRRLAIDKWPGFADYAAADVETHVGEVDDLDWVGHASVDFAFASNVFEHIPQSQLATLLAKLRLKLTPGGRLCILQPNYRYCYREYFDDYTHVTVYSHVSLADFLAAHGYQVLDCQPRFLPLTIKSRFPVHPLLIKAYLRMPFRPLGKQMLIIAAPELGQEHQAL